MVNHPASITHVQAPGALGSATVRTQLSRGGGTASKHSGGKVAAGSAAPKSTLGERLPYKKEDHRLTLNLILLQRGQGITWGSTHFSISRVLWIGITWDAPRHAPHPGPE